MFHAIPALADSVAIRTASQIPDSALSIDFEAFEQDPLGSALTASIVQAYAQNGVKWARVRPTWAQIEMSPGVYQFAGTDNLVNLLRAKDMKILMLLDGASGGSQSLYGGGNAPTTANGAMTPWLNYVQQMVQRYLGSVSTWEIWNEPNLSWKPAVNASDYADLAQQTAARIRSLQPSAYILLGGTSLVDPAYLQTVLPIAGNQINAISIHPYRQYPEQAQDVFVANSIVLVPPDGVKPYPAFANTGAASYREEIGQLRNLLSNLGFPSLDIWSTETGYPSQNETLGLWPGSPTQQTKHLARHFLLNLNLGIARSTWFLALDRLSIYGNFLVSPTSPWVDDYRNLPNINSEARFATFSPAHLQPSASINVAANSFTSSSNISVTGTTITTTSPFPDNFAQYSITLPQAGNYTVSLHMGSTSTTKAGLTACSINNSSVTFSGGKSYNFLANNSLSAILQGSSDFSPFYYSPCVHFGPDVVYYPVISNMSGTIPLTLQLQDAGTKIDEIRIAPLGALIQKPAFVPLKTIAAIFDDRVGVAGNYSADFRNVDMTASEWTSFQSAAFLSQGQIPLIAYWVGLAAADSFPNRSVEVHLPTNLADPILIDPLDGTWTRVGPGGSAASLTLRVQDYPLILTSLSVLAKSSAQILLAEETYNYPNPVRGDKTFLRFYLTQASDVTIEIYTPAHERIHSTKISGIAGRNVYPWGLGSVANGVYFWKISVSDQSLVKKILVLR
ncbi:MAG: T9SS type A sorting domain-containing protein [Elusimicrobia bacterium]|nr:T9SS type A sorting domain-containing protein [Elusimicrobiota bacterium]